MATSHSNWCSAGSRTGLHWEFHAYHRGRGLQLSAGELVLDRCVRELTCAQAGASIGIIQATVSHLLFRICMRIPLLAPRICQIGCGSSGNSCVGGNGLGRSLCCTRTTHETNSVSSGIINELRTIELLLVSSYVGLSLSVVIQYTELVDVS